MEFTEDQIQRYSRHILLPEVGGKGQKKLLNSKVLVIGAGGLGSSLIYYLAAAGVGTIGVVDADRVDLSNLQRQILHRTEDIGKPKVESAQRAIAGANTDVKTIIFQERLTSKNALEIFEGFDLVADSTDNFPSRYLINDACVLLKKPCAHGSVFQFEGQATLFIPGEGGPCYRCLFPEPPPRDLSPSCQEAGVLGVLPGLVGMLQCVEALKYILGIGKLLTRRMLLVDALSLSFREVKIKRDSNCPICGDAPTISELIDYEDFCSQRG